MPENNWMEEVAKAGGWEEHHITNVEKELELKKREEELAKQLSGISNETWPKILDSLTTLKDFVVAGGTSAMFKQLKDGITDTLTNQVNMLLSPLKNELMSVINQLLAPIMPYLQESVNNFNTYLNLGIKAIHGFFECLFTGKWDELKYELFAYIQQNFPWMEDVQSWMWGRILSPLSDPNNPIGAAWYAAHGIDVEALNQAGTAGGLYSGQFEISDAEAFAASIDIAAINDRLSDLDL